jgi:hypothetical protein
LLGCTNKGFANIVCKLDDRNEISDAETEAHRAAVLYLEWSKGEQYRDELEV